MSPALATEASLKFQGPTADEDLGFEISAGQNAEEAVDWNSADQVASHVSRTTLAAMQQLWRSHGLHMDNQGRAFAEKVFSLHAQALKDIASMKTPELKPVAAVVNTYTTAVREIVLDIFKVMRQSDDNFAQGLYQTSRRAFTRNLREALDAKDATCADKLRRMAAQHEQALATQRAAARAAREQDAAAMHQDVMRQLREENRQKLAEVISAITSQLSRQYAQQAALEEEAASGVQQSEPSSTTGGRLTPRTADTDEAKPCTPLAQGAALTTGHSALPDLPHDGSVISLEILQALVKQDDDGIGSVLARKEMEATIKASALAAEELKDKVEELKAVLGQERLQAETWKEKWSEESGKTAAIKRECLQIIVKCERKVKELQQQHLDDMEKRDVLLQRAKHTIAHLETRVHDVTGGPADPRLSRGPSFAPIGLQQGGPDEDGPWEDPSFQDLSRSPVVPVLVLGARDTSRVVT